MAEHIFKVLEDVFAIRCQRNYDEEQHRAILKRDYISKEEHKKVAGEILDEIENSFTSNFEAGEGIVLYISKFEWQVLKQKYLGEK